MSKTTRWIVAFLTSDSLLTLAWLAVGLWILGAYYLALEVIDEHCGSGWAVAAAIAIPALAIAIGHGIVEANERTRP